MRGLRLLRASAALPGCLCVLFLLGGTPAYAHTALEDASPGPGAKVGPGLDVIALTFDQLKAGTTAEIGLTGPGGAAMAVGQPVMADDSLACVAVPPLVPGITTVTYTVTAADGDTQTNSYQFQVLDGAKPAVTPPVCRALSLPAPGAQRVGTPSESDRTTALVVLGGAVAVALGGGVLVLRSLRRSKPTGRRRAST